MTGSHVATPLGRPKRYVVLRARWVVRVFHATIGEPWRKRGMHRGEREAQEIEDVLRAATGLRHIARKNGRSWVDFKLRPEHFPQAAIALRLAFSPDPEMTTWLAEQ